MKSTTFRNALMAGAAIYFCAFAESRADVIETMTWGPASLNNFSNANPIDVTFTGYNTTLSGPLAGIIVTITATGSATPTITNASSSPLPYAGAGINIPLNVTSVNTTPLFSVPLSIITNDPGGIVPGNANQFALAPISISGSQSGSIPSANWAQYEGSSLTLTFAVGKSGNGFSGSATSTSLSFGGSGTLSGTVTIDFENVPEPTSLALLGTMMAGVPLIARRRSKNRAEC